MINLTRRSFLQLLGLTTASVAFGEDLIGIAESGSGIRIREIRSYDIVSNRFLYRYDILTNKGTQLNVTVQTNSNDDDLDDCKKIALSVLKKEMKHRKIRYTDLINMPLPMGIESRRL